MKAHYPVDTLVDAKVPMRDGVNLSTDIYLPRGAGRVPTVLMRTPYGNNGEPMIEKGRRLANDGYACVIQDCRGRWDSDGAPDILVRRGDDLLVYTGNGPGGLTGGRTLSLDLSDYDLMTGVPDVTLRDRPDLVVRERGTGRLLLVESRAGGFKSPRVIADGAEVYDLVD